MKKVILILTILFFVSSLVFALSTTRYFFTEKWEAEFFQKLEIKNILINNKTFETIK